MSTIPKLSGGRFQQSDFSIGRYAAHPPAGTTLADVMHPEYFGNNLGALRQGMEITVLSDDYALDCRLRVLTVSKTYAKMRVLDVYAQPKAGEENKDPVPVGDIIVKWAGPQHQWRFSHGGSVIKHGFATEEEARTAADLYLAEMKG